MEVDEVGPVEVRAGGVGFVHEEAPRVLFEEVVVEEEIVVPCDDDFVVMRLGCEPGELGLKLVERTSLCEVSSMDEEVARWQSRLAVVCV